MDEPPFSTKGRGGRRKRKEELLLPDYPNSNLFHIDSIHLQACHALSYMRGPTSLIALASNPHSSTFISFLPTDLGHTHTHTLHPS